MSRMSNKKILKKIDRMIYNFIKRLFDIIVSLIGLLPLLIMTVIIKMCYLISGDKGRVIYIHKRVGKKRKELKLYKFRTMVCNSDEILNEMLKDPKYLKEWKEFHKFDNDPRITKIGKILRKLSLDELPQILNILKGEMSLIGPRPLIEEEVLEYRKNQTKLLSIKPGLTGWWACNGRSCITSKQRQKLELYYVDHCNILLDIKIIFLTIVKVLKSEGAK